MAPPAWAPHAAAFCDLGAVEAAHEAARQALEAALRDGSASLLDMVRRGGCERAWRALTRSVQVRGMEEQLTAEDTSVRARAVLLLAEVRRRSSKSVASACPDATTLSCCPPRTRPPRARILHCSSRPRWRTGAYTSARCGTHRPDAHRTSGPRCAARCRARCTCCRARWATPMRSSWRRACWRRCTCRRWWLRSEALRWTACLQC
jgi:hypothetical protein